MSAPAPPLVRTAHVVTRPLEPEHIGTAAASEKLTLHIHLPLEARVAFHVAGQALERYSQSVPVMAFRADGTPYFKDATEQPHVILTMTHGVVGPVLTTTGAAASAWGVEFTGYLVGSKVHEFLDFNALSPGVIEAQHAARRVRLMDNENRCDDLLREFASKRSFKLAFEHVKSTITSKLGYTLAREMAPGAHSAPSAKSALNLRATLTQTGLDAPWVGVLEAAQTEYSGAGQSSRVFKREDLAGEASAQSALNRLNRFVDKLGPKKAA